MNFNTEPVTLAAALNAALVATVNLLAIIFNWEADVIAGLNLVLGAWIAVVAFFVRQRVTPTQEVALTKDDVYLIEAGQDLRAEGTPDGPAV